MSPYIYASVPLAESQNLFVQGNHEFLNGHFKSACENYVKIPQKSSVIWHNMGNCFFNEKNYVQALICWYRAQLGADWYQLGELFALEKKVLDILHIASLPGWQYEIKRVIMIIPKLLVQIVLMILLMALLLFLYRCWRWSLLYGFVVCNYKYAWVLMFGIVTCGMVWWCHERISKQGQAIVIKENVMAYAGPETSFHEKFKLPLGSHVNVMARLKDMHQISYNKQFGWVEPNSIEII